MSYSAERASIEQRWATQWVTGSPSAARTPTAYENVPYEPIEGTSWVRITILNGEGRQLSMGDVGNNTHRYAGVIALQIFTPAGAGSDAGKELADLAAAVFRNQRFDSIYCRVPYISGTSIEGQWHQTNINVPFWRDEYQ